ncbi:pyrroloquinoline quinone biosynthesis peptide chaperone PqqD [Tistrella mobilis]|uniref:Coenzyme PQQ synthesis D n=1 Tax=Tistrella mobilis (strain KA081020-065) TaxID=1110502 RepID=I3TQB1_TISMK|nr:pyrroloquinoline quinone biosynthesis peptide chaperone PqqD [Tistrella mobilis]AFK54949.1 coenzyme PQQ synthesis D [Tistrella mobilis KA081020-065]MAM75019.1 pyrroloquinoline quinone biosynthesis peptide chaperone PqqD [Tistrella sp.]
MSGADLPAPEARPLLARGVRLRHDPVRDRVVLLAPESVIEANPTALAVLKACTGEVTIAAMAADLATRFGADRALVEADIRRLIADLARRRLVVLA